MRLYLVRHGETEQNARRIHQTAEVQLSPRGQQQAAILAERLQDIPFTTIYTSPFVRTQQTAAVIQAATGAPLQIDDRIREFQSISAFDGHAHNDPALASLKKQLAASFHDPDVRVGDEEKFEEFHERTWSFLQDQQRQPQSEVLVVTHSAVARLMFLQLITGEKVSSHQYQTMASHLATWNTGLTLADWDQGRWRVLTWNDHAHLLG